ncbi:L,D-transpeptidase family protein [Methylomonas paludis]|uniref:L,D-transpeptidase family protein n=1 Tax=Methylomonas paludis TaxID=1173101 RepID=A0A975MM45_9GAMM|nr:L,D-transpeptidase family protein [Methylomonas paludis]QWF69894.1 L,D-transpeptidase family protein [Methylomonas paludis]
MKARLLVILLLTASTTVSALTLAPPKNAGDSLIGNPPAQAKYVTAKQEDTLIDIAVNQLIGQDEIVLANPQVDRWLPGEGTQVRIPSTFLLPNAPRQGVIVNLPEMRIYFYADAGKVIIHSIGIGREDDWKTPLGKTSITGKTKNPSWTPPKSIIAEHLADGDVLKPYYPPGPNNPLGLFAFRLGIPGYLIHSTNKTNGVGMRVSHGCIRMYPSDIEQFFPLIKAGTPVNIVNQPIKVGWHHDTLYMEVYPALEETPASYEERLHSALKLLEQANAGKMPVINSALLQNSLKNPTGIPVALYQRPAYAQNNAQSAENDQAVLDSRTN